VGAERRANAKFCKEEGAGCLLWCVGEKKTRRSAGKRSAQIPQSPHLASLADVALAYGDAINGSALANARNHPWKSPK
jgi:hypothetical protein